MIYLLGNISYCVNKLQLTNTHTYIQNADLVN